MKKRNLSALVIVMAMLCGCQNAAVDTSDAADTSTELTSAADTATDTATNEADITKPASVGVEALTEHDAVISVTLLDHEDVITNEYVAQKAENTLLYKLEYDSNGVKIFADMLLPDDYLDKDYPIVIYFPDVKNDPQTLCNMFAGEDVIVVRYYRRGLGGSEGTKDICGEDYTDAEILLDILSDAEFTNGSKIFTAGAAEGSIFAMRLAADYSDKLAGCAVVDIVSDIEAMIEQRPELADYYHVHIGSTPEEAPEEYEKRSAVHFTDEIEIPMLLVYFKDNPMIPNDQTFTLTDALDAAGGQYELMEFTTLSSDFVSPMPLAKLISWIKSING